MPCKDCLRDYEELKSTATGIVGMGEPPEPNWRPTPHPGPRCVTHHRAVKKARKLRAHESRVQKVYGLGPGEYDRLYEFQGGRCAICRRATGASKRLAVDHDHRTGKVRGLCCSTCNQILGHFRDDPELFVNGWKYLRDTPYERLTNSQQ